MLIQRTERLYDLTVTPHEAVELIKKLSEYIIGHHSTFSVGVSDTTGDEIHPAVLRIEVIK